MKIGVLGSGAVAQALGAGFQKRGYDVMLGTRRPAELTGWADDHAGARVGGFADTAAFGDLLVLAVKGAAASQVLRSAGSEHLDGKIVIDATNPIADAMPTNGVIKFFTGLDHSLMEQLQAEFPQASLVKAFNSVGNQHMVDPTFEGGPPTMFICGNDAAAKQVVSRILDEFGWDAADMGGVESARVVEPLCILWCLPGVLRGEWNHALKLLR